MNAYLPAKEEDMAQTTQEKAEPEIGAAVEEFVERMGVIAQADGLPRIAGRLLALLVIYGGPVSFAELSERLQVSRGSISNNTRLLEQLGVIDRVGKPGDRQDYFRLSDDPYRRLLEGVVERMSRARAAVETARKHLPPEWADAQGRLAEFGDFYTAAGENTRRLIEAMRRGAD